ncbi:MAG: M24 family metallopeptidase [Halobacteriaceae archaeon]
MDPDLSDLDAYLDREGLGGYLLDADARTSDQFYLSGFDASDPFVTLRAGGATALLVSGLEYARAREESRADEVRRLSEYDYRSLVAEHGEGRGRAMVVAAFCSEFGSDAVAVPRRFPVGTADGLREQGVAVETDEEGVVEGIRAVKTDEEVASVRAAQRANEVAMHAAKNRIESATVEDGVLHGDDGPLTSEDVREEIESTLLHNGCRLDETIVSCGADAAVPHDRGSGPLRADEPIIVDIFPQSKTTRYHADMTRTFVKGEPSRELRGFYEVTREAFEAALSTLGPGVTGEAVDDAVCDVYEDAGYPTTRSDEGTETGFIHSTGHGVGLDVHEAPRLGQGATDELEPGHVVTVEPGLYDPDVGGVRIEDLVVVTGDGYENLTDFGHGWLLE